MPDYQVGFWNLENLFAPEGHPGREPWIAAAVAHDLNGWTQALFDTKITQLVSIISALNNATGPDILGVCEVENRFVLDQLTAALNTSLPARHYDVIHADSTADHRGIDTAFIYDDQLFSVDPTAVFSHFVMRRTGTRDITQVTFTTTAGNELVAFANHWPSRSGSSAAATAGYRSVAGETLAYWHERVRQIRGNDMAVIALGDLNDNPWDPAVVFNANSGREPGDTARSQSAHFHNLAWNYLHVDTTDHNGNPRRLDGTLYYDNNGDIFDQILVNRSLLNGERGLTVIPHTATIAASPAMVDHRTGQGPINFGLPKGNAAANINVNGYSDHFPITVTIHE
jgi:endonuclease/exonuclease/phosphatase family metal-dependent hydrolase